MHNNKSPFVMLNENRSRPQSLFIIVMLYLSITVTISKLKN